MALLLSDVEVSNLSRMLSARGYSSTPLSSRESSTEWMDNPGESAYVMRAIAPARPYGRLPTSIHVILLLRGDASMNVRQLRQYALRVKTMGEEHGIVVINGGGVTTYTSKAMRQMDVHNHCVEFVRRRDLGFCLIDHDLVPPHRRCDDAEQKALAKRYHITDASEWMTIFARDPVVKYYNWPVGTLVEVTRRSLNRTPSTYYRMVHDTPD